MPNTLAHLGVQALATRTVIHAPDLKWIYLACVIPDLPWIAQRTVLVLLPSVDPYELRLYAIAQSSLGVSLLACGALALVSQAPRKIFGILSLNTLLHLLLDSLQTKWGNGVHLLAPVSWEIWNLGLFWPESAMTLFLTAVGLGYFGWAAWRRADSVISLTWGSPIRLSLAGLLLGAYALLPWALRSGPEATDSHSLRTLRSGAERAGREIALDRAHYLRDEHGDRLRLFSGEELVVVGRAPPRSAMVSVRGRFLDSSTLKVDQIHVHDGGWRNFGSYIGLAFVAAAWMMPAARKGFRGQNRPSY